MALPMAARSTRCPASAPIEAPRSSTIDSPLSVGQIAAIAGRSMPAMVFRSNLRHRHQRAGIAGRNGDIRLALLHRIDGKPHRRLPAALAQRLAGLVVHLDRDVGVHELRGRLELGTRVEQRLDGARDRRTAEFDVGMAAERQFGPRNDHRCPMVAPHGVERDADFMRAWPRQYRARRASHNRGSGTITFVPCRPARFLQRRERARTDALTRRSAAGGWNTASGLRG